MGRILNTIKKKLNISDKRIALTFDDGPNPTYTPNLLDLLKQFQVKATFFVKGKELKKNAEIAKRIVAEGHELGNHTYNHRILINLDSTEIYEELYKTDQMIKTVTGEKTTLFRPPFLSYDKRVIKISKRIGYTTILCSIDTSDYKRPGVEPIVKAVLLNLNKGEIVLMHDSGGDRNQTIEAVGKILLQCQKRNFECVTVSTLLHSK